MNLPVSENVLIALTIIDVIAKGFGLWFAAQNKQRNWYIAILILNTAGILPAIYLQFFQKKTKRYH